MYDTEHCKIFWAAGPTAGSARGSGSGSYRPLAGITYKSSSFVMTDKLV